MKNNWKKYHTKWSQRDEIPSNPRIIRAVLSLGSVKGKKILEVGSGMGRDSIYLAKMGAYVTLLDYIDTPLIQAKVLSKKHNTEIKTTIGSAYDLSVLPEKYDIVFSQGLLEHFEDPLRILREKKKISKPGGYVISDVPQTFHIYTIIKHFLMSINKWTPGWETQFTIKQLEALYLRAGFKNFKGYGDWSHPSWLIKALYITSGKRGYLYKEFKDNKIQRLFRRHRLSYYTYQHIGVIGKN